MQIEFEIETRWSAFPLHPEVPEEGMTLEQLFAGRNVDLPQVLERLEAVAREAALPFARPNRTYNSRSAQELGKWAESQGRGEDFHWAVFQTYFVEGKNIGRGEVLLDVIRALRLPLDEALRALTERSFQKAVDADWTRSREMGITAVPTLVLGEKALVGAQPYTKMAALLEAAGVKRRAHET